MKKEKMVDLKPKVDKISKEHLTELQKVINLINNVQFNIGKIESQKHNLLHELSGVQKQIIDMQDMFTKEYGTHDINVSDGTINWPKEENKDEK
tara:strand:+ start:1104 stop:1385 length:282 start_codon:yes stop_codon:yes gene_type:complete